MIRVGTRLYGYCGGVFGRDSYGIKRVEALGADWVVVREYDDIRLYAGSPEDLEPYSTAEAEKEYEKRGE